MAKTRVYLLTGFIAVLFTLLFYHQWAGLNLLLFEVVLIPLSLWKTSIKPRTVNGWVLTAGVAATAVFTFIHASSFVIIMNVVALFLWAGWLLLPEGRSLVAFARLASVNLFRAPLNAVSLLQATSGRSRRIQHLFRQLIYLVIPFFLILVFLVIYLSSNPHLAEIFDRFASLADQWFSVFAEYIDFSLWGVILFGLLTGIFFMFRSGSAAISSWDRDSDENLHRRRRHGMGKWFRMLALQSEYRAGVFLLVILNLLILLQNMLDIWYVWFHFEWNGQYLRQFVHEGTYLLILSILISIGIILWLYRGNLNFLQQNRMLRRLSYAWLIQNMVLVISVAIRNAWYISYFALAYKRIGVFIFLVLTLVGLITVLIKVGRLKTPFFLLRVNAFAAFILLTTASLVNWDVVIARYNFAHYQTAFVHLDWLCTLSDKALPYLDKSEADLEKIRQVQDVNYPFDHKYMSPQEYHKIIQQRKSRFIADFEQQSTLSLNIADYMAFLDLKSHNSK
ncbi:MAG: DUF4173 domain-containing protein [Bacteroidetes bacterium]|nr:DUF4173 domain-containing protein [Bacteroidota bacterium]